MLDLIFQLEGLTNTPVLEGGTKLPQFHRFHRDGSLIADLIVVLVSMLSFRAFMYDSCWSFHDVPCREVPAGGTESATVRSPTVIMRITNPDGSKISTAKVGDNLSIRFQVDDPSSEFFTEWNGLN